MPMDNSSLDNLDSITQKEKKYIGENNCSETV